MNKNSKIYVAGHSGLVGQAILKILRQHGFSNLITRTHQELDLTNSLQTQQFFAQELPEFVFIAAAKVGGIFANQTYPAQFIYINTQIQSHIIHYSYLYHVKKLLFLTSSCIYPKNSPRPIPESALLSGYLEHSNEPYAIAKIHGIKMCQSYNRQYGKSFIGAMPCNVYGLNTQFDFKNSHVIPALIHRFVKAKKYQHKKVTCWGTGTPYREFIFADDLAEACIFLMQNFSPTPKQNHDGQIFYNVGTGKDIQIKNLALLIQKIVNYPCQILWDTSQKDGHPQKLLDVSRLTQFGWKTQISLKQGLKKNIDWFIQNYYHTL